MEKITNKRMAKAILINIILIGLCGIICGFGFRIIAQHRTNTMYDASMSVVISPNYDNTKDKGSAVEAAEKLIPTYQDILSDNVVSRKARKLLPSNLQKKYDDSKLSQTISTTNDPQSLVIKIHSQTGNSSDSVKIVNAVAEAFKSELPKINPESGEVHLLSKAKAVNIMVSTRPDVGKYTKLGLGVGILMGMTISVLLTTWKNFL
ncbi:MAG: hypothetical protein Q3959_01425 [Limosilactobacillus sp.]|uniref:hypothetical protein n=1 Tax=Limosilactobacillus sp. TaxID=2773925 RepID=UPI0026F56BC4|nr:hypothetical protein [Limosilactobacillus sp.]